MICNVHAEMDDDDDMVMGAHYDNIIITAGVYSLNSSSASSGWS